MLFLRRKGVASTAGDLETSICQSAFPNPTAEQLWAQYAKVLKSVSLRTFCGLTVSGFFFLGFVRATDSFWVGQ